VQVLGHFQGGFGSGMENAPIAELSLPEYTRDTLFTHNFYEGVAELESLVASGEPVLQVRWPSDVVAMFAQQMYEGMVCRVAWKVISRGAVIAVLDAVRNKVLAFSLEIEQEAPDAGEAAPGEHPVPQEKVTQIFHTQIYGGQSTVAVGSRDVVQRPVQVQLQVQWEELEAELHGLGLGAEETTELKTALESDAAVVAPGELGPATQGWLGKITQKVGDGSLALASGVTTDMIAALVLKALGAG
jgi:AbiTii